MRTGWLRNSVWDPRVERAEVRHIPIIGPTRWSPFPENRTEHIPLPTPSTALWSVVGYINPVPGTGLVFDEGFHSR